MGQGWYAKPAVAYMLEKGLATWRDFVYSLDATAHVDQESVTQALQQMEAAWPEGEEHYAKLSVNALIGLWARNMDLIYTMRTSNHQFDGSGCQHRELFLDAAGGMHWDHIYVTQLLSNQAWNKERETPTMQRQEPLSSLRIVLLKAFLSEMAARIKKVTEDPEVKKRVLAAGWAGLEKDQTLVWKFQMYDAEKKQELVDPNKTPLPQSRVMQLLEGVAECLRPEVVQRFHATRRQAESYQSPIVVFMMEVAHRGDHARTLYENMAELVHNMIWNLMASRMRLETIGRSPLANRIAQLLAKQSAPCV